MTEQVDPLSPFEARRRIDTLRALHPLRGVLSLDRPQTQAIAEQVARLPGRFLPRWADATSWPEIRCTGVEHLHAAGAEGRGVIVVPAHFGGYHWTIIALLRERLPVSLLVDGRNREFFDADVFARMKPLFPDRDWGVFEGIASEQPNSLWQLRKAVKAGRATLMFIDGNSGIDGRLEAKGSVAATLLERPVWVRPGIAALAQATGAAIVTVSTRWQDDVAHFEFAPALRWQASDDRIAQREAIMRELFAWLEAEIRARPEQWEEWWLLPRWWIDAPEPSPTRPRPDLGTALPGLVGRRLGIARESSWCVDTGERRVVVDLELERAQTEDPELVELFEAAERRELVLTWARERDDISRAKRLLERGRDLDLVRW